MLNLVIASIATVVGIAFMAIMILVIVKAIEDGIEPPFPCPQCKYHEDGMCKLCVDGADGKPRPCAYCRGELKCLTGARRK